MKENEEIMKGSFKFGDIIKAVRLEKYDKFEEESGKITPLMLFKVEWEKRKNGIQPLPSYLTRETLAFRDPEIVIEYYENCLREKIFSQAQNNKRINSNEDEEDDKENRVYQKNHN